MTSTRIALVTGANKGIGFETARQLAGNGVTAVLGCRNPDRGAAAAARIDGAARAVQLDVTDQQSVDAAAALLRNEYGRLDLLVNNAAVSISDATATRTSTDTMRTTYETNVFGVVAVTNAMLPLLRRSPAARIVNVTSGLGSTATLANPDAPWPPDITLQLSYNSSKAALNALTVIYAQELSPEGIRVDAVTPGFCATDLNDHQGFMTPAQGAATVVGVLLDESSDTCRFLGAEGVYPW